jgi:hypothetical protein
MFGRLLLVLLYELFWLRHDCGVYVGFSVVAFHFSSFQESDRGRVERKTAYSWIRDAWHLGKYFRSIPYGARRLCSAAAAAAAAVE